MSLPLISGLLLSLASGLHCVAMCGPLALAIKSNFKGNGSLQILLYHLGRLMSYVALGVGGALLGETINLVFPSPLFCVLFGPVVLFFLFFPL